MTTDENETPDYITDARFIDSERVPEQYVANRSLEDCRITQTAKNRLQEMGHLFTPEHVEETMRTGDVYRTKDMEQTVFVETYHGIAFYVYANYEVTKIITLWAHVFDRDSAERHYSSADLYPIDDMNIKKSQQNRDDSDNHRPNSW